MSSFAVIHQVHNKMCMLLIVQKYTVLKVAVHMVHCKMNSAVPCTLSGPTAIPRCSLHFFTLNHIDSALL